jgi:hypothetical protein
VRTNDIKTKIETEAYRNGRYLQFSCGVLVCYIVDHYCLIIKVLFYVLQIPEGIDLDQAHFSELYNNMKARFHLCDRSLPVTCDRSVYFGPGYFGFLHQ